MARIEVVSPNGKILFANDIENTSSKKILRIIQFKNISEHDKKLLFASADSIGASGDTSCSELISAGAFPYIAKKNEFVDQLIEQCDKLDLRLLKTILIAQNKMINVEDTSLITPYDNNKNFTALENALYEEYQRIKVDKVISLYHQEIQLQWRILCTWIIENKNVFDFTDCLINGALKHAAGQLKPGDIEEMYKCCQSSKSNPQLTTSLPTLQLGIFSSKQEEQLKESNLPPSFNKK